MKFEIFKTLEAWEPKNESCKLSTELVENKSRSEKISKKEEYNIW